jgi:hypothetical protein
MNSESLHLNFRFSRFILWVILACIVAEAIIFILDVFVNLAEIWYLEKFKELSDVAQEKSFGTWFSVVQNFMVSVTALVTAVHYRALNPRKGLFLGWLVVSLFFAYISLDDHLMLHERIGGTLGPVIFGKTLGNRDLMPTYNWHFLLGPFFVAFGVFFLIFLFRQFKRWRDRVLLILGLALWGTAVLMDAWEGTRDPYGWLTRATGFKEIYIRHTAMLLEEMLEMAGSTIFLFLLLTHLKDLYTREKVVVELSV